MMDSFHKYLISLMRPYMNQISDKLSEHLQKEKKKKSIMLEETPNFNSEGNKYTKSMHQQH